MTSSPYELAQINVARLRAPLDSPVSAGFVAGLEPINRVADQSPGFIWRLQTETGHAADIQAYDDELMIVNLSVWVDYASLHAFVYRSAHSHFVRRRRQWFELPETASSALWWVASGVRPTVDDGVARLERLRMHGPTPDAFSLRRRFDAEGRPVLSPLRRR